MRVIIFIMQKVSLNDILLDVPKTAKHLSWKQECPKKGHPHKYFCIFVRFFAKNVHLLSQKRQNLFSENEKPRFWDIKNPENYFVASLEKWQNI